jgi:hypothetical protein
MAWSKRQHCWYPGKPFADFDPLLDLLGTWFFFFLLLFLAIKWDWGWALKGWLSLHLSH